MTEEPILSPADRMAAAVDELIQANALLEDAQRAASAARIAECTATNRVNKAQDEIDKLVCMMRTNTPPGTDWYKLTKGAL